jgi:hypothetical protein
VVTLEEARGTETTLEVVEGMQFDRGYLSPYFVTDESRMECVLEQPLLLLHDGRIAVMKELVSLLEQLVQQGRPLVLVADEVEGEALATLVLNKLLTQSAFTTDPNVVFGGHSAISTNASEWFYTGNSQGGIMGSLYAAVSTEVTLSVLGVAGGPYSLLLPKRAQAANILTPTAPSASHVAFTSLRMEPTWMILGQAAGAAAAMAARDCAGAVHDVDVGALQAALVAAGQRIVE